MAWTCILNCRDGDLETWRGIWSTWTWTTPRATLSFFNSALLLSQHFYYHYFSFIFMMIFSILLPSPLFLSQRCPNLSFQSANSSPQEQLQLLSWSQLFYKHLFTWSFLTLLPSHPCAATSYYCPNFSISPTHPQLTITALPGTSSAILVCCQYHTLGVILTYYLSTWRLFQLLINNQMTKKKPSKSDSLPLNRVGVDPNVGANYHMTWIANDEAADAIFWILTFPILFLCAMQVNKLHLKMAWWRW